MKQRRNRRISHGSKLESMPRKVLTEGLSIKVSQPVSSLKKEQTTEEQLIQTYPYHGQQCNLIASPAKRKHSIKVIGQKCSIWDARAVYGIVVGIMAEGHDIDCQ